MYPAVDGAQQATVATVFQLMECVAATDDNGLGIRHGRTGV